MRHAFRNILLTLALCFMTAPLFAQTLPTVAHEQTMPSQLMLQASPGTKQGTYQDAAGNIYNVTPAATGGTQCDPQGCMVQVCNGGACDYYYCRTGGGCKKVTIPSAMIKERNTWADNVG